MYALDLGEDAPPTPLTPEGAFCYGDFTLDHARRRLVCVREDHTEPGREAVTTLVGIPLDGGPVAVLASGDDFYSTPRISPDGTRLCWLSWRHPRMPWDGTELWVAAIAGDGALGAATLVAGGVEESIYQPGWLPDGSLVLASDKDGWWRLYRAAPPFTAVVPVLKTPPPETEFGRPQWILATATWASAGQDQLVVSFTSGGPLAAGARGYGQRHADANRARPAAGRVARGVGIRGGAGGGAEPDGRRGDARRRSTGRRPAR